jgi:hypothetical protein
MQSRVIGTASSHPDLEYHQLRVEGGLRAGETEFPRPHEGRVMDALPRRADLDKSRVEARAHRGHDLRTPDVRDFTI